MTSKRPDEAFVWVWLPGAEQPVVAGRLRERSGETRFIYGKTYLERDDAISLYAPELPLRDGWITPLPYLTAPGCIIDARPDGWGQRVIMNRLLGAAAAETDPADFGLLRFLLESGSDRTGALDFQESPDQYIARDREAGTLEELATSAQKVEEGVPLSPAVDAGLLHGSSIGGARPKALLEDGQGQLIAKFSSSDDPYAVVKGEFVAMKLAQRAGLKVAPVQLTNALDKVVLLVERFDRIPGTGQRRGVVSALTMLGLSEMSAGAASYAELSQIIRRDFTDPLVNLRELLSRITFNILIGNTDDHARNTAAFWDGQVLALTPAYDICPIFRLGGEATQGMIIGDDTDSFRFSQVAGCVERASIYQLTEAEAREIVDRQIDVIEQGCLELFEQAELSHIEREQLSRVILHDYALEGYSRSAGLMR